MHLFHFILLAFFSWSFIMILFFVMLFADTLACGATLYQVLGADVHFPDSFF